LHCGHPPVDRFVIDFYPTFFEIDEGDDSFRRIRLPTIGNDSGALLVADA
jgi:hypothetical protein